MTLNKKRGPAVSFPQPKAIQVNLVLYRLDEALLLKEIPPPLTESSYHHS